MTWTFKTNEDGFDTAVHESGVTVVFKSIDFETYAAKNDVSKNIFVKPCDISSFLTTVTVTFNTPLVELSKRLMQTWKTEPYLPSYNSIRLFFSFFHLLSLFIFFFLFLFSLFRFLFS